MVFAHIRRTFIALAMSTVAIAGAITLTAASPASAANPDTGTANAFGLHVTLLGGNVLGPIPDATLPADGSPVQLQQTLPITVPGLLTANTLNAEVSSTDFGQTGENISAAAGVEGDGPSVPGLSIAGILDVQAVESTCNSNASGSTASTTVVGLSIDGAAPLSLPSPIPPNSLLPASVLGPLAGLVTITLNAQAREDRPAINGTAIVVDALKVTLLSALGSKFNTSITVAESSCSATGPDIESPPTVTGITPKYGPIAGGTQVTVTGNDFLPGSTVSFGGTPATNVVIDSPSQLTATSPAHAAGPVNVVVTNAFGSSPINANDVFTYENVPVIAANGLTPLFGPTAGGTAVTITGSNFGPDSVVTFGGNPATNVVVVNAGEITAKTPPGAAGPVPVVVTDGGGSATAPQEFTYVAPPTIDVTGLTPLFGPTAGGTPITITGTGYAGPTTVSIGGTAATNLDVVSPTEITAVTPPHVAGAFLVTVTDPGGSAVSTQRFTFVAPPSITTFAPSSGPTEGGTVVTITGQNLTGTTSVTFGGVAGTDITNVSDTSVTVVTPPHAAGGVSVALTSAGGSTTAAGVFTYVVAPVEVTGINPSFGPVAGGTTVAVTGAGFAPGSTVAFVNLGGGASTPAKSTLYNSATSLTVVSPAHAVGPTDVIVTTPGVGVSLPVVQDEFTFETTPTVLSVTPTSGPIAGGTPVIITGSNFGPDSTVAFGNGGNSGFATNVVVSADGTTISAVTPAHSAGLVAVTVADAGGTGVLPNAYTYVGHPVITSVVPNEGPSAGGNTVAIHGTGLSGTTSVTFGGTPVPPGDITNVSATEVDVTAPAGTAGTTVSVNDTTPGGTATLANAYTYVAPPTVASFTPTDGPTAGGTLVTFTGTNLSNTSAITFGGVAGTGLANLTSTSVTVLTPANPTPGPVAVALTTPGGTVTAAQQFTYVGPPMINVNGLTPDVGPTVGGTLVTISGSSLSGTTKVTFAGVNGTSINNVSDNEITVVDPANPAGPANVVVTAIGGSSAPKVFTYVAPPVLTSIVPSSGPTSGGTSVTITGTGFQPGSTVTIGGAAATVSSVTATTILAVTPPGNAGAQPVIVTDVGGPSNALSFTYIAPPVVGANGLNPAFGPTAGGTTVTITGQNLSGTTSVTFDGLAGTAVTNLSSTSVSVVTPAHAAGAVPVVVTAAGGTATAAQPFTYVATPSITSLVPNSGPISGGTPVTITGSGFAGPTTVAFGANQATSVVVVNSTTITLDSPASTTGAGPVNVTVTDVGGTSGPLPFTYLVGPQVTGISPTSGPTQGGETVNIAGANLCGNTSVKFGNNNATVQSVNGACTLVVVTEPPGQGTVPVVLDTTGGSANSPENFTYIAPGYWQAASDGGVFAFGGATYLGSVPGVLKPGQTMNSPIVAMADTPDHGGYWLFAADGGVFAFGDACAPTAPSPRSCSPDRKLNGPVVAAEATPDGGGYRMFAADGGVFDFGGAAYEGGLPGRSIVPSTPGGWRGGLPLRPGRHPTTPAADSA